MSDQGSNLIGDLWQPALGGATFEVRAGREPFEPSGVWPRSGAEDALRALQAAEGAAEGWAALGRAERLRLLGRLPEGLEALELAEPLALAVGLEASELAPRLDEELFRLREALEILREGADGSGAGLFQAHWSDFAAGLAARLVVRLVAGHTALVIASARLPAAAHGLAQAILAAGLPAGVVSVLHDDTGEALRAALGRPELAWLRLRGSDEQLAKLAQRLDHAPPDGSLWPLRNAVHGVARDADPAREAALVVEKAFGRSSTLSGQMPGQVGRVVCHQRLFSRFCEELLQCLEVAPDARRPVTAIDGDLPEHVRRAWVLGLDEGATPIFGGEPPARAGALPPTVFTNVEPGLRLAGLGRPAPVLSLIRGPSDEGVRGLVLELEERGRIHSTNEGSQA